MAYGRRVYFGSNGLVAEVVVGGKHFLAMMRCY